MTRRVTAPEHPLARPLRDGLRGVVLAHRADVPHVRPCGTPLPLTDAHALIALLDRGPLTATALAAHLDIDRTNVSRLLIRLEADGLVVRRSDPDDARARLAALTDRGLSVATAADRASRAHFSRIVANLGAEETSAIVAALDTLASALRAVTSERESSS